MSSLLPVPILPRRGGVYLIILAERVVYVGQSVSVLGRISEHARWRGNVIRDVFYMPVQNHRLRLAVESVLIDALWPAWNGTYTYPPFSSGARRARITTAAHAACEKVITELVSRGIDVSRPTKPPWADRVREIPSLKPPRYRKVAALPARVRKAAELA